MDVSITTGKHSQRQRIHQRINNMLLVAVIVTSLYVVAVPFLPQLLFAASSHGAKQQQLQQAIHNPAAPKDAAQQNTSQENRLMVPAMLLDQPIVEGDNMYRALDKGVWRWPGGSTPDKGGNTVLLGHRFTYTQPKGVFYFLNKVTIGDSIGIAWNGRMYRYKVTEVKVVPPSHTEILAATDKPTLTMYTCTPLWLPKDRLVVRAELEQTL